MRRFIKRLTLARVMATAVAIAMALPIVGAAVAQTSPGFLIQGLLAGGGGRRESAGFVIEDVLQTGEFFAARPALFTLRGRITDGAQPLAGVQVTNDSGATATTNANGDFSFNSVPQGNQTLTPNREGYTFTPISRTLTLVSGGAEANGLDFVASADDVYENDDACANATSLRLNTETQRHTFGRNADQDWVSFETVSGTRYLVEAQVPPSSNASLLLETYPNCAAAAERQQSNTFNPGIRLVFTATQTGPTLLRWANKIATTFGPSTTYQISARDLPNAASPGAAIIVAGKLRDADELQTNIHNVAQQFRQLLRSNGYAESDIYLLATDPGQPGFTTQATAANLQSAITTWAKDHVGPNKSLVMYIMDHGDREVFYLNNAVSETATPTQINTWLNQLEADVPEVKITVILEACNSGSFIDLPAPSSLSKRGRVIVSSTDAANVAYATPQGALFSDYFIARLGEGATIYNGFQAARWATIAARPEQTPWLDDDGDGIPNEPEDGLFAQQRGLGNVASARLESADQFAPFIASTAYTLTAPNASIVARVTDDVGVTRAWVAIYPPSYTTNSPSQSRQELVRDNVLTQTLTAGPDNIFGVNLTGLTEFGVYRVVVHAEDGTGVRASPVAIEIRTGYRTFLPLVRK
jgi:hypothetical protein